MDTSNSLHEFIKKNYFNFNKIKAFVHQHKSLINNDLDDMLRTPIFSVLLLEEKKSIKVLKLLMQHGAELEWEDVLGNTPLIFALQHSKNNTIIIELLKKGADVQVYNADGQSPLCLAFARCFSNNVIEHLIKACSSLHACMKHESVWHCFVETSMAPFDSGFSLEIIKLLIKAGADVNAFDSEGRTALFLALSYGAGVEDIKLLLSEGKPNCCMEHVVSQFYATYSDMEIEIGPEINEEAVVNYIYLNAALEASRDEEIIRLLLENCTNTKIPYPEANPAYIALCQDASSGVVQLLLDAGYPLDNFDFHRAIANRRTWLKEDVLRLLIQKELNMNSVNVIGQSVLCSALKLCGEVHDINLLLSAGASLNSCVFHDSMWDCAIRELEDVHEGDDILKADIVKLLIDKGDPTDELELNDRWKALLRALVFYDCDIKTITLLLDSLAGKESYDVRGGRLLHYAVMNKKCKNDILKLLIKEGWLVSEKCHKGYTALHIAAQFQVKTRVIKILLKNGGKVNDKCSLGDIPLHLAWDRLNADIIKLLLNAGSNIGNHAEDAVLKNALGRICQMQRMGYYEKNKLDCCFLLVKYYLIQNPQFDFQGLVSSHEEYHIFSQFAKDCMLELWKMESVIVGHNQTLREFLEEYSTRTNIGDSKVEEGNYDFNQILKIYYEFPLFFPIISVKIGRQALEKMLHQVNMHTRKCAPDTACIGEDSFLIYDCVCHITQYLSEEDMLKLFLGFNYSIQDSDKRRFYGE